MGTYWVPGWFEEFLDALCCCWVSLAFCFFLSGRGELLGSKTVLKSEVWGY